MPTSPPEGSCGDNCTCFPKPAVEPAGRVCVGYAGERGVEGPPGVDLEDMIPMGEGGFWPPYHIAVIFTTKRQPTEFLYGRTGRIITRGAANDHVTSFLPTRSEVGFVTDDDQPYYHYEVDRWYPFNTLQDGHLITRWKEKCNAATSLPPA